MWRDGKSALLGEYVEDRAVFFEAMKSELSGEPVFRNASNPKSGVADNRVEYLSDTD